MKNFFKKFLPDIYDNEPIHLTIVKIILLAFLMMFAVVAFIIGIAVTNGLLIPISIIAMVWYVLRYSKT